MNNWFEGHLNWSYILAYVGVCLAVLAFWGAIIWLEVRLSPLALDTMGNIVACFLYVAIMLPVALWVLRQKGRSLWWALLFGLFSPCWVSNKWTK